MIKYIIHRIFYLIIVIFLVSIVSFVVIQLPPGDFLSKYVLSLIQSGIDVDARLIRQLEEEYGLNQPVVLQYFKWLKKIITRGDFGTSFQHQRPVLQILGDRILLTMAWSFLSMLFVWGVSIPIGIYTATHQYSFLDYIFTFFGFLGMATPNFLLAIGLLFAVYKISGVELTGIMSLKYQFAPLSFAKILDILKHLPIPIFVVGTAGTAAMIRTWRAMLLDELSKQYVIAVRAKGVKEIRLILKYPVRVAMAPALAGLGGILAQLLSGGGIVAIVMNLPTTGPILLQATLGQDMYLAASALFLMSIIGLSGRFISDLLLMIVDPRVRMERGRAR